MTTPLEPTADDLQRLGYIALLCRQAAEHAANPYPLSTTAVLMFHDAVELFLGLVADRLGLDLPREFMAYWKLIDAEATKQGLAPLTGRSRMDRLNSVRVAFKHKGVIPAEDTISRSRDDAQAFLTTSSANFFGVEFDEIDLISLVPQERVRAFLLGARAGLASGQLDEALGCIVIAFDHLMDDFTSRRATREQPAYTFGQSLQKLAHHGWPRAQDNSELSQLRARTRELANFTDSLVDKIEQLERGLTLVALGIDFRAHARFRSRMPSIMRTMDGMLHVGRPATHSPEPADVEFGIQFVVSTALHLAQESSNLDTPRRPQADTWHKLSYESADELLASLSDSNVQQ